MGPRRVAALVAAAAALCGCASTRSTPQIAFKTMTMPEPLYRPPADHVLTSTLLDFESPSDATFVDAPGVRIGLDSERAGNHVLLADGESRFNLASLVRGRDFGGAWDVVGVKLWSDVSTTCDLTLKESGRPPTTMRMTLAAQTWTTGWLDVAPLESASPPTTRGATTTSFDSVRLQVVNASQHGRFLVDDVMLAQSRITVSDSLVPRTGERWTVSREGTHWRAAIDGRSFFELPAAPFVAGGYRVVEGGLTRAVFENEAGSIVSLDRTGRLIQNGAAHLDARVMKISKAFAETASPARLEIVGDEGRLERSLPGDRDNDGFDERRGCYVVHAVAGRATLRLSAQGVPVKWPVLEVLDLPPGVVSVLVEGEVVPWPAREADGRVTVELPVELKTPVEVQVRVK